MISVVLYQASKQLNSTFQTDYSGGTDYAAVWKGDMDIDNPDLEIYAPELSTYPQWNMMYIPSVSSYYWVTGIASTGNQRWRVTATMDYLATYRNEILNTSCYIEYGFNTDASGATYRLRDSRQNISQVPTVSKSTADITGGIVNITTGVYILSCVGREGGVATYRVTSTRMTKLLNSINTDITDELANFTTVEEILSFFTANSLSQGSAIQAIRSCIWLPLSASSIPTSGSQNIYLGDFDTGQPSGVVDGDTVIKHVSTVSIPWPVSDWRRMNCQILVYVPFIGTVGIPVDQCNDASSLTVTWCCEVLSGGISVRINAGDYTVYTGSGNIGCSYAIGSSNVPIQNFVSGALQAIGGAIQVGGGIATVAGASAATVGPGGLVGTTYSGLGTGVMNIGQGVSGLGQGVMQALTPVVQCAGSLSGNASIGQSTNLELCLLYFPPIDDATFSSIYGHPVMRIGKPVAGYCKTQGFSLNANARASELAAVNSAMDSGVFIV